MISAQNVAHFIKHRSEELRTQCHAVKLLLFNLFNLLLGIGIIIL